MSTTYKLSTFSKIVFGAVLVAVPVATSAGLLMLTDDGIVPHENSPIVSQFVNTVPTGNDQAAQPAFSATYGQAGGAEALVLYDANATHAERTEVYAIAAGNLATHFGTVEVKALEDYQAGDLAKVDGAIYVGTDYTTGVPETLVTDVLAAETPILWVGENIEALSPTGTEADFIATYGWDPTASNTVNSAEINQLVYDDSVLTRFDGQESARIIDTPIILDDNLVDVVASGTSDATEHAEQYPWVIRSGNITYLAELPFHYIDKNDLYLVFADLYYHMLAPDRPATQRAAVRIEDVNAESSPEQLRALADYFYSENVPFQVAVIPVMLDQTPDQEDWYGLSIADSPEVVEALQYMQDHGGTLIQHGTTHQYGGAKNPYSGRSGDDYEFYGYGCSAKEHAPFEWEACTDTSWVRKTQPVAADDVVDHRERLEQGRDIMIEAGLGEPKIFETPHYTASVNAYVAMTETYDARYEQVEYYAGMLSGIEYSPENSYGQIFPYSVHDIYGSMVYPENLQNPTEKAQNNHPARPPQLIVDRAEANMAVTESTASFYFHPFLDLDYLAAVVDGIKELGYEFVAVTDLE